MVSIQDRATFIQNGSRSCVLKEIWALWQCWTFCLRLKHLTRRVWEIVQFIDQCSSCPLLGLLILLGCFYAYCWRLQVTNYCLCNIKLQWGCNTLYNNSSQISCLFSDSLLSTLQSILFTPQCRNCVITVLPFSPRSLGSVAIIHRNLAEQLSNH